MDFTTPHVVQHGNNYQISHGNDSGLFVRFFTDAVKDEEASVREGRPIFKDIDLISIIPVGDKTTEVIRPVDLVGTGRNPPDDVRFAAKYAAFKSKTKEVNVGTPITEWAPITKSTALELKGMNIHTVEAMAEVPDSRLGMGMRDLRAKAQAWLASAKSGGDLSQLIAKNQQLEADLAAMKAQIAALGEDKPKRGRPRKEVANDDEDNS